MSLKGAIKFDRAHIYLSNLNHVALGFGTAILLQHYLRGDVFIPVSLGWLLVIFACTVHIYAWSRSGK